MDDLVAVSADAMAVAQAQTRLQRDLAALAERARDDPQAAAAGLAALARRGAQGLRTLHRTLESMNEAVRALGMQPLQEAVPRWRITVHDTAQAVGREATLDAEVGAAEVDRRVLQALQAPLVRLLRNAVDHGIEPPGEREAKGKPRVGRVLVRAETTGSRVRLEVSDDGRGVDSREVARHAVSRGLVDAATATSLRGADAAALLFLPGMCTATAVTRTSGRGVGLDVVATTVRGLGGDVFFADEPTLGGATVVLDIPASMVSTHALLVSAGGQSYALPASRAARVERVAPQAVTRVQGHPTLTRPGGAPLPLTWLASWAPARPDGRPASPNGAALAVVVLRLGPRVEGLVVDAVVGDADVVIRSLPWNLRRVPGVAGAAVLEDGAVAPWLVPEAVAARGGQAAGAATSQDEAPTDAAVRPSHVLVVDDSVTSRTLISQILRGAGYEVQTANDGAQAWAILDAPGGGDGEPDVTAEHLGERPGPEVAAQAAEFAGLASQIPVAAAHAALEARGHGFLARMLTFGFLVLLTAFGFAAFTTRTVARPIEQLAETARRMGEGEFGTPIRVRTLRDEVGLLVAAFESMRQNFSEVVRDLQGGAELLSSSAAEIDATAKEYATTTAEQAAAVAQVSTTMAEVQETRRSSANSARNVVEAADSAADLGHEGRTRIAQARETVEAIGTRVEGIAYEILELSAQNARIGEIVETVRDLAEQSNLLAVNASIEAAKAGEQGRGFAVMAAEVRSLAEQSKAATLQIRGILKEIERATASTVMATEEGTKRAADGQRAIVAVQDVVDTMAETMEHNADSARQIAEAASQQAAGIKQISFAIEGIRRAGEDTAQGVGSLESAVEQLTALSKTIREVLARYHVGAPRPRLGHPRRPRAPRPHRRRLRRGPPRPRPHPLNC